MYACHHLHQSHCTNQQTLIYPCNCPQQSRYTKHKSTNTYVPLPPPTPLTLHKKQISKNLCNLATAHSSHTTQDTNQKTLMYPCHRSQQLHCIKNHSAKPYVHLQPYTSVTLHKTQISKPLCTLATAHTNPFTQNTNKQSLMYS